MPDHEPDQEPDRRREAPWRRPPPAVLVTAAALAGLATAVLYVTAAALGPTTADTAVLQQTLRARTDGLTTVAVVLTTVGGPVVMAALALAVGGFLLARRRGPDAVLVIGAMLGGAALFRGLKLAIDRRRPPELAQLVTETNESLPSGHATMSVVVLGALVVLAWAGRPVRTRVAMVASVAMWAGAVGATRVYLGVHWFTDVLAGWLVGLAWLTVCVLVWSGR